MAFFIVGLFVCRLFLPPAICFGPRSTGKKWKSVGRARCILICIWEKFASPPSNPVKMVWVGLVGLPLYLNEFLFISISRVECVKLLDRFCVRLAALFIGPEFWLPLGGQRGRLKKNYAEIKIYPEGHLQSGRPDKRPETSRKKVNFVVSNKKCKCCESVKRTMGKWDWLSQGKQSKATWNKTVKERKSNVMKVTHFPSGNLCQFHLNI